MHNRRQIQFSIMLLCFSSSTFSMLRIAPTMRKKLSHMPRTQHTLVRTACTDCKCSKPYEFVSTYEYHKAADLSTSDAFEQYQDARQRLDSAMSYCHQSRNIEALSHLKTVQSNLCPNVHSCMQPFVRADKIKSRIFGTIACLPQAAFILAAFNAVTHGEVAAAPIGDYLRAIVLISVCWVPICALLRYLYSTRNAPMNHVLQHETLKINMALKQCITPLIDQ